MTASVLILHERGAAITTVVNEPGPLISPRDWTEMTDLVAARLPGAAALVCTGSLLPGVPDDGYVDLIRAGRRAGVPVIIDASGPALMRCAEAGPELEQLVMADVRRSARTLRRWPGNSRVEGA